MTTLITPNTSSPLGGQIYIRHFLKTGADQTIAFQNAIDSLPSVGGSILLERRNYAVEGKLDLKGKSVVWQGDGTVNGQILRQIPGIHMGYDHAGKRVFMYEYEVGAMTWDFSRGMVIISPSQATLTVQGKGKAASEVLESDLKTGTLAVQFGRALSSTGNGRNYTSIRHEIADNEDTKETAYITLNAMRAGTLVPLVQVGGIASSLRLNLDGNMRTVSLGAPDTGGKGFRALVVEN